MTAPTMNSKLVYVVIRHNTKEDYVWMDLSTVSTCPLTSLEISVHHDEHDQSFAKENPVLVVDCFDMKPHNTFELTLN